MHRLSLKAIFCELSSSSYLNVTLKLSTLSMHCIEFALQIIIQVTKLRKLSSWLFCHNYVVVNNRSSIIKNNLCRANAILLPKFSVNGII